MSRPKQVAALVLFAVLVLSHQGPARAAPGRDDASVVVTAVGTDPGGNAVEARRLGAREAVARVVASLLDQETRATEAAVLEMQILSQHDRFATVARVLREGVDGGAYRVEAEFRVDRLGVVETLRRAGILPECRVMVSVDEWYLARPVPNSASQQEVVQQFTGAGCRVLLPGGPPRGDGEVLEAARRAGVDVVVLGQARGDCPAGQPVRGFVSCRARVDLRAVLTDTGEVMVVQSSDRPGADLHESLAARKAFSQAARLPQEFVNGVLLAPVRPTRRVRIEAVGLADFRQAIALTRAVEALPVVRGAVLLSFGAGRALIHADVATPEVDLFGAILENRERMKPFALVVERESRFRLQARVIEGVAAAAAGGE